MANKQKKFYITTAIDYVNAERNLFKIKKDPFLMELVLENMCMNCGTP